jgi:hypothetical protein
VTVCALTHASNVIAPVSRKDGESLIVTFALVPLKTSALPYLPAAVHVAEPMEPAFPFPDRSATVDPDPSLNEYAATRPERVVAVATFEYPLGLPAASTARTR